jgi:PAS domain S-box-containing protein
LPVTDDLCCAQRLSDGTGEPNAAPNHGDIGADVTRERLAAAIDRFTYRVVIFDSEDRILLGNASWWSEQSRYGLKPKIGDHYHDYVRGIAASGRILEAVGNEEQWVSRRLADRAEPDKERKYRRLGGDIVMIRDHHLPDGGMVTITTTISERVEADAALAASERRFRNLAENSIQGLFVHFDGTPVYANQAFADMIGLPGPDDVLALESADEFIAPVERERLTSYRRKRLNGEWAPECFVFQALHSDGSTLWLESRANLTEWEGETAIQLMCFDVTERHDAIIALEASESRFRHFAEAGSDWYWETDADNRFTALLGGKHDDPAFHPNSAIGKTRDNDLSAKDRNERPREWHDHLATIESHRPFRDFVYAADMANGERYWLRTSGIPAFDNDGTFQGHRGVTTDISAEVAAKDREQEVHQQLRTAIDSIPDPTTLWDEAGRLSLANKAWLKSMAAIGVDAHIGMHREDHVKSLVEAGIFPDAVGYERAWIDEWAERQRRTGAPYELETKFGSTIMIRDFALPHGGIITFTTDVTERKRADEERELLERQLQHSQRMETIGILSDGIAHDFNNILAPITGYCELLLEHLATDEIGLDYVERILGGATRAADLVGQVLAFSRREAGANEPIRVDSIALDVVKLIRAAIPTTIEIREFVDPDCAPILGDHTQIHQVLMNLCTNASQAIGDERGTLTVTVATQAVDEQLARLHPQLTPGPHVKLSVADTGPGISPDIIDKIFEPFFTTKERGRGTGLGLAMAHGLIAAHGGHITVESRTDVGSRFDVFLPVMTSSGRPILGNEESIRGGTERILLIDDEAPIIEMAHELLTSLGYDVSAYTKSLEAWDAFSTAPDSFDIVITDNSMPHLSGLDLARQVHDVRGDLPIIVITGFADAFLDLADDEKMIAKVILKPFGRVQLDDAIRDAITKAA